MFHEGLSGYAPATCRDRFRFIVILTLAAFLAACETTAPPEKIVTAPPEKAAATPPETIEAARAIVQMPKKFVSIGTG